MQDQDTPLTEEQALSSWKYEVDNDDTRLGFEAWLENNAETWGHLRPVDPAEEQTIAAYRRYAFEAHHSEGVTEIDDDALVAIGDDDGAYVEAWIWIERAFVPELADEEEETSET